MADVLNKIYEKLPLHLKVYNMLLENESNETFIVDSLIEYIMDNVTIEKDDGDRVSKNINEIEFEPIITEIVNRLKEITDVRARIDATMAVITAIYRNNIIPDNIKNKFITSEILYEVMDGVDNEIMTDVLDKISKDNDDTVVSVIDLNTIIKKYDLIYNKFNNFSLGKNVGNGEWFYEYLLHDFITNVKTTTKDLELKDTSFNIDIKSYDLAKKKRIKIKAYSHGGRFLTELIGKLRIITSTVDMHRNNDIKKLIDTLYKSTTTFSEFVDIVKQVLQKGIHKDVKKEYFKYLNDKIDQLQKEKIQIRDKNDQNLLDVIEKGVIFYQNLKQLYTEFVADAEDENNNDNTLFNEFLKNIHELLKKNYGTHIVLINTKNTSNNLFYIKIPETVPVVNDIGDSAFWKNISFDYSTNTVLLDLSNAKDKTSNFFKEDTNAN